MMMQQISEISNGISSPRPYLFHPRPQKTAAYRRNLDLEPAWWLDLGRTDQGAWWDCLRGARLRSWLCNRPGNCHPVTGLGTGPGRKASWSCHRGRSRRRCVICPIRTRRWNCIRTCGTEMWECSNTHGTRRTRRCIRLPRPSPRDIHRSI